MKVIISTICLLALTTSGMAQENELNYSSLQKNEEKIESSHFLKKGDLTINAGASYRAHHGLSANISAEYMFNKNLGLRAGYHTSHLSGKTPYWGGFTYYDVDLTFHFIQSKRWDVYAYAGMGSFTYKYKNSLGDLERLNRMALNAGVGARYKIKPNFGVQLEIGTKSSLGVFKTFDLSRLKK